MRLVICLVLAAVLSAVHQSPADFSGTWIATKEAPAGATLAPGSPMGARFAIKQDAKSITISRLLREASMPVTYALDGTPTRYRVPGRMCEGDQQIVEAAAWDNGAIALTLSASIAPGTTTERPANARRLFKKQDADTLVVETSINQQGKMVPVAMIYKRTSDVMPAATAASEVKGAPATIAQVAWISGDWIRNGPPPAAAPTAPGLTTEERWSTAASGGMQALARSTRGTTLASFEFLCISEKEGSLVYTAMPDGRTTPTFFTLTKITADSATFEDPTHDYPQLIRYTLKADGTLETVTSLGNGQRAATVVLTRK